MSNGNLIDVSAVAKRRLIERNILKSNDKTLRKNGKNFTSKFFLEPLFFSDFLDIVFYYVDLQEDKEKITVIESLLFHKLLKKMWDEKCEKGEVEAGGFSELNSAWCSDSGPIDGYAGAAEVYFRSNPGYGNKDFLLEFFVYPESLSELTRGARPYYKKRHIEELIFPKFRRKRHFKRLDFILDFADDVCRELRELWEKNQKQKREVER